LRQEEKRLTLGLERLTLALEGLNLVLGRLKSKTLVLNIFSSSSDLNFVE